MYTCKILRPAAAKASKTVSLGPASEALDKCRKRPRCSEALLKSASFAETSKTSSFALDRLWQSIETEQEAFPSIGWDFAADESQDFVRETPLGASRKRRCTDSSQSRRGLARSKSIRLEMVTMDIPSILPSKFSHS